MRNSQPEPCYVVLHIGNGPSRLAEQQPASPLIVRDESPQFQLSDDIWIERLDERLARNIQKACEPSYYGAVDVGPDKHLYSFVSRVPKSERTKYGGMSDLKGLIALSRLVNPTSTGDRYSAHVHQFPQQTSPVFPIQYIGVSPDVIMASPKDRRDWLSIEDGKSLRKLVPWSLGNKRMHKRVHHAYWNHEHSMRSYYLDIRWTLVVSAFEALMTTQEEGVRRQFRDRVGQLAAEFGVSLNNDELNDAYTLRSNLVHAQSFLAELATVLPTDEHVPLYHKLESLLRATVLRCLLDENFGNFFKDAAAVEARWPLTSKPKSKGKRHTRP
jgi:hypothetical protein